MKQTVYVDVLVIINIYINYGLLLLTCYFRKLSPSRIRILISSVFGGLYSVVILTDISDSVISVSRLIVLMVMTAIVFGFKSKGEYFKSVLSFFSTNLVFAGAMFMLWFLFCPENMYYNSGIVYFGIDAFALVMLTVSAYFILRIISVFTKSRIPQSFSYNVKIYASGKEFTCRGLFDSGNSLCDPFSGEGVTIVHIDVFKGVISEEIFYDFEDRGCEFRLIPVRTVCGTKLLPSFRADGIQIKSLEKTFYLERPVIALSCEKIHGGEYGALLYSTFLDNAITGKGEDYVLYT